MSKSIVELAGDKLSAIFSEFKNEGQLSAYIVGGFPTAIAAYLQSQMNETNNPEVNLVINSKNGDLMKFTLRAERKGDSVAFIPSFEMGTTGADLVDSDSIDFDDSAITSVGYELQKNSKLMDCFKYAFSSMIYTSDGNNNSNYPKNWIPAYEDIGNQIDEAHGVTFEEELDCATAAACMVALIFEQLCQVKDDTQEAIVTYPSFGSFKVTPIKGGDHNVTFSFDKKFKGDCKSDSLAEKMAQYAISDPA